jgi:hypothetical protein
VKVRVWAAGSEVADLFDARPLCHVLWATHDVVRDVGVVRILRDRAQKRDGIDAGRYSQHKRIVVGSAMLTWSKFVTHDEINGT